MQRILNDPDDIVDEMLKGFLKAHSDIVEAAQNPRVVKAKNIPAGKVGVVTGGGSGHKPAFIGYVGRNLCDAAAVGRYVLLRRRRHFWMRAGRRTRGRELPACTAIIPVTT